jgi:3',5'-cyclic AMP phosphodiesterase CpdA
VCLFLCQGQRLECEKNVRINIKKFITGIAISFTGLLITILIADGAETNLLRITPQVIPSYSGFAEIQGAKNRFLIVGDTQNTSHWEFWRERNDRERKLILDEMARREQAFVVYLGDLTTRGSSEKHWRQFDEFHKGFRDKKIPCFPILGNHEFYGNNERALQNYFGRFPHLAERRWYSLTWKNVAIILLDSNFSTLTKEQIEEQFRWYLSELEKYDKDINTDFIIVCCHEPPFTNSRVVSPNMIVKNNFADLFLRFKKTCLFFSGHSHSYERFQMDGKFFIVSGGGGGPRHKVIIDPRKRRYQDLFSGPELRFFHFCEIENREDIITFRVLRLEPDETFTVVDPFIIPKIRR